LLPDILLKNNKLHSSWISDREAGPIAKTTVLWQSAAPERRPLNCREKTPISSPYGLVMGFFQRIMAGSTDLAGPGVGQVRKQRHKAMLCGA
jgi:hypothetical protein